jgi:putative ABC transport system permease protein
MDTLLNDIRYTLRAWRRSPAFIGVAVLTLALGIGANTTMFSIVNATLLQPLPFPEPDRLMSVWKGSIRDVDNINIVSWPNFRDWQARSRSFESLAIFDSAGRGYNLTSGGEPEQVSGLRVTASYFTVLGVRPMLGRTFLPAEESPGNDRVVVLSHGLWMRRYGGDRSIVGRTIQIDGEARTVVGVMPESFRFQFWSPLRQLWVPAGWTPGDDDRQSNSFVAIGRLKPGVGVAAARGEMDTIGRSLATEHPAENSGQTIRVLPMSEYGLDRLRAMLFALLGVVGFVLLIACVNVANLTLARAAARQRELAIRCALGAGRGRITCQLLTESILLGVAGGVAGVVLAWWGTKALFPVLPPALTRMAMRPLSTIDLDLSVLAFTTLVSVLSGVLFGLAPAVAAFRTNLNDPLKEQARGSTGGRSRLRYGLVASEVALTLVVLAGAGVMIVSVARLLGVSPGLDPRNILVMSMSLPQEDLYYGPPGNVRFCEELDREVSSVPGVLSVSAIGHLPLSGGNAGRGLAIEGQPDPGVENQPGAGYSVACPNIARTLGIRLLAGREFTFQDTVSSPGVVLINESMAKRFWPRESAVGKRIKIGQFADDAPWLTVVGVIGNARHSGLDADVRAWFVRPYSQAGWPVMTIATKTAPPPGTLVDAVKRAIAVVEPNQPVVGVRTMEDVVGGSVSSRRFPMFLLSGFALLALVLAGVGIAGVVGYSVVQRTQEIGVRMALGAQPRDVLRLVIGHSLVWTLLGVGGGIVAAIALLRFLGTLLYNVTAADPLVLAAASTVLIAVAIGASYLPARRATRIDSVAALRGD